MAVGGSVVVVVDGAVVVGGSVAVAVGGAVVVDGAVVVVVVVAAASQQPWIPNSRTLEKGVHKQVAEAKKKEQSDFYSFSGITSLSACLSVCLSLSMSMSVCLSVCLPLSLSLQLRSKYLPYILCVLDPRKHLTTLMTSNSQETILNAAKFLVCAFNLRSSELDATT